MIEVIQAGRVERCQERNVDGLQCDHFAEHFGAHQHALSEAECLRWPSQDDIEDAAATAQIEAMTDEEVEATLLDEEAGVDRETIKNWSRGVGVFAKAMIKAKSEIAELTKERDAAIARANLEAAHHAHLRAERDAARVECERMRAVYEAACALQDAWRDETLDDASGDRDEVILEREHELTVALNNARPAIDAARASKETR